MEIKGYNVMIHGWNFFEQPIKNELKTFDNIRKTATSQGDDYNWMFTRLSLFQNLV